jgi:predicted phage terminase large subunit-like protein
MFPDKRVMLASYEAEFAASWGRKARDLIDEHGDLYGVSVRSDARASNQWELQAHEGGMTTAGVGGPFTGKGADLMIIDDPVKNSEGDTLQRPEGEALWPDRWTLDLLERRRKGVGSYWWAAMFQGRPAPEGGGMFKREWFRPIDHLPGEDEKIRYVRFWDLAATEADTGTNPDWTAGVKLGRHPNGTYVLADVQHRRASPHQVSELIKLTAEVDGRDLPIHIELEGGGQGKSAIDFYQRLVLPEYAVRGDSTGGKSKVVRADPVSARAEAGHISYLRAPWNHDFFDELESFPNGSHDDMVDALSGAFAALNRGGETWSHNAQTNGAGQEAVVAGVRVRGRDAARYIDRPGVRV